MSARADSLPTDPRALAELFLDIGMIPDDDSTGARFLSDVRDASLSWVRDDIGRHGHAADDRTAERAREGADAFARTIVGALSDDVVATIARELDTTDYATPDGRVYGRPGARDEVASVAAHLLAGIADWVTSEDESW